LPNATLDSLIQIWPSTLEELLEVHGIGPFKAERYGEELLSILNQFSELKPKTPTLKAIENEAEPKNGDQKLAVSLRIWRTEMAAGKPAFTIFNDKTLADLVKKRPRNIDELLAVHGIGPAKAEKLGQDLLEFFKE
jgi:superfamily II DNA helicase RecQ